ncbi:hypothetical protein [Rhodopirellula sp. MGV]|uniref:hypothetical protein n=1 Tax=Rhodopirellula sp. MGV TaxID=2023130 RepID=UPI000B96EEB6|nr:hypothetical protein [Rhodopirellula sp. MGV]OYP37964.1 hypothetical protein CGZ80_03835 [Rhodopirellula sp. MGV]PNY34266.1 hypothetical protein C2E31_23800 [Rhodopirellula baltica]
MKKFVVAMFLISIPAIGLTGCGDSGNKVTEKPENSSPMTDQQMQDYEAQMRSGAATSSRPGN